VREGEREGGREGARESEGESAREKERQRPAEGRGRGGASSYPPVGLGIELQVACNRPLLISSTPHTRLVSS
jgi:hypothetical protein